MHTTIIAYNCHCDFKKYYIQLDLHTEYCKVIDRYAMRAEGQPEGVFQLCRVVVEKCYRLRSAPIKVLLNMENIAEVYIAHLLCGIYNYHSHNFI